MPAIAPVAAAPEVAAADDDRDVDAEALAQVDDVVGGGCRGWRRRCRCPIGPANASPDGLKTMRRQRGVPVAVGDGATRHRSADLDLGELDDRGAPEQLGDRLLVVLGVRLVEQRDVLKNPPRRPSTIFGDGRLGLALVAGDRRERRPLGVDDARPARRRGERYFGRAKAMCTAMSWASCGVPPEITTSTRVDAAAALDVQVAVDHVAVGGLDAHDLARARSSP